jgi:hypothetical protein
VTVANLIKIGRIYPFLHGKPSLCPFRTNENHLPFILNQGVDREHLGAQSVWRDVGRWDIHNAACWNGKNIPVTALAAIVVNAAPCLFHLIHEFDSRWWLRQDIQPLPEGKRLRISRNRDERRRRGKAHLDNSLGQKMTCAKQLHV